VLASFSGLGEDILSSNTEVLSNLFVLGGVWSMVADDFGGRPTRLFTAGALIGVAFLYRYQAGAALAAYVTTMAVMPGRFSRPLRRLGFLAIGWLIPVAAVVAFYAGIDGLADLGLFLNYQSSYLRPHEVYRPLAFARITIVVFSQAPFLILSGWQAAVMCRRGGFERRDVFLLSFLAWSILPFFVGGHYFPHYIVQAIPALVLLTEERVSELATASSASPRAIAALRYARRHMLTNVVAFWIANTAYYATVRTDPPSPNLARFIRDQTSPPDAVFLWTERSRILFELDRSYATRFLTNEFLTGRLHGTRHRLPGATAESARAAAIVDLWPVLLSDLEREKPRVILDDPPDRSGFSIDRYPILATFVHTYYEPARTIDGFCVYLRKAS